MRADIISSSYGLDLAFTSSSVMLATEDFVTQRTQGHEYSRSWFELSDPTNGIQAAESYGKIDVISNFYGATCLAAFNSSNDCIGFYRMCNDPYVTIDGYTDVSFNGAVDGSVQITSLGGLCPYLYDWDNGVNGLIIIDATSGNHYVAVTDANGCAGSATALVGSVGGVAPTSGGTVTNLLDQLPITDGRVDVYGYNPYQSQTSIVATGQINSDGTYFIPQVLPIGQYFIVVRANTNLPQYANTVPTCNWAVAPMVTAVCEAQLTADLEIIDLSPLAGSEISGGELRWDATNKSGRAGDPILGIDVSLEQIPGGIIAFTESGDHGTFEFDKLPQTGLDTTCVILVSMPGKDVVQRYNEISINSEDSVNLDFTILANDSIYLYR